METRGKKQLQKDLFTSGGFVIIVTNNSLNVYKYLLIVKIGKKIPNY